MAIWTNVPQDTLENMFAELQNRLAWVMTRLDSRNIREIDASIVNVKNLRVESIIDMEENAVISWNNVSYKPDISDIALSTIQNTYIDAHGVWTPNVYATNISTLNGKITNAQIDYIKATQIDVTTGKIQSAQIDNLSATQITTGTLNGIKVNLNSNDFSTAIDWNNGNKISVDPISGSMYFTSNNLYHSDAYGDYYIARCGGNYPLKIQIYGGYLEVFDGQSYATSTIKGRVLLTT